MRAELFLASSNPGKLREYRALATGTEYAVEILPRFSEFPAFPEDAPTFAENAAGKALHYSRYSDAIVFADDSGLVVPALGGAPGVHSARYAGPNAADAQRIAKLLNELKGKYSEKRRAHFVCVIAAACKGKMLVVVSDSAEGEILEAPRGQNGFGYDPIFYCSQFNKSFAELNETEKNLVSHRGKAFRKFLEALPAYLRKS